jgi:hypothetical protein
MTRSQWYDLPETEREQVRQASAAKSGQGWDTQPTWPRSDWDRAMDMWKARDAYRVENAALGLLGLFLLGFLLSLCAIFTR